MTPPRNPPRPHKVNTQHPRYNTPQYDRGSGSEGMPVSGNMGGSVAGDIWGSKLYPYDPLTRGDVPMRSPMGFVVLPTWDTSWEDRIVMTVPIVEDYHYATLDGADGMKLGIPQSMDSEFEQKLYRDVLEDLNNGKGKSFYANTNSKAEAMLIARGLRFYFGGAEVHYMDNGSYVAGSKGYYHYVGA